MKSVQSIHWDLSELHDSTSVDTATPRIDDIEQRANEFSDQYKGRVSNLTASEIHSALKNYELIRSDLYQISQFAHLNYSVDIQDAEILKFVSLIDERASKISNILLFFFLEVGQVPKETLDHWCDDFINEPYRYVLVQAVDKNQYRLTEKEEQLINLKDLTGIDALRKMYGEHTSRYEFKLTVDGQEKVMNGSECRALRYHDDPNVRRDAMQLFFERYQTDEHIMVHLFNSIIKDYNIERIHRGYDAPISGMNIHNDLPNELVHKLHELTTESNVLVQRYYALKQQILGLDQMTLADIYAPMQHDVPTISWESAKQTVLESFQQFDDQFYEYAKDMFDSNRVDVFPSKVKRGGAFCSSSRPEIRPYVMLNYLGKQRDVATLAHELGHAIHAYFSSNQPLVNYHAILPVCETASVFCEMLVVDALKKSATSKQEKMVLLATKLEDIFATSHRQNMFSCFEQRIHDKISSSRLSAPELCEIYAQGLKDMFGDSVKIPKEYHWEWATIPHMLDVPFYVYSYNFGNLLVLGLYQLYLDEGQAFIPKLKRILSAGSSKSPVQLMRDEGIDILSSDFWQGSIAYIESILDELQLTISMD
tara:strand:- start:9984 stop:11765 length:1782 start_codon:yes stop_codon:yes gene_type:complete